MASFSTPAIVLHRIDFGDYDVIMTLFTRSKGKLSVIAKSARKSTKRFAGILERFSVLNIICSSGRGKGLPVLQEATLTHPFSHIRSSIIKTGYASYWSEIVKEWMETGHRQIQLYELLQHVLQEIDLGRISEAALSILFQLRFLKTAGLVPNLKHCNICGVEIEKIQPARIKVNLVKGGIVCDKCSSGIEDQFFLSKGTIKQLLWIQQGDLTKAVRVRLSPQALKEGLAFLEAFVPYHLGKEPRSLKFLRQIR